MTNLSSQHNDNSIIVYLEFPKQHKNSLEDKACPQHAYKFGVFVAYEQTKDNSPELIVKYFDFDTINDNNNSLPFFERKPTPEAIKKNSDIQAFVLQEKIYYLHLPPSEHIKNQSRNINVRGLKFVYLFYQSLYPLSDEEAHNRNRIVILNNKGKSKPDFSLTDGEFVTINEEFLLTLIWQNEEVDALADVDRPSSCKSTYLPDTFQSEASTILVTDINRHLKDDLKHWLDACYEQKRKNNITRLNPRSDTTALNTQADDYFLVDKPNIITSTEQSLPRLTDDQHLEKPLSHSIDHYEYDTKEDSSFPSLEKYFVILGLGVVSTLCVLLFRCSATGNKKEEPYKNVKNPITSVEIINNEEIIDQDFYVIRDDAKIRQEIEESVDNIIDRPARNTKLHAVRKWTPPSDHKFTKPWYKVEINNDYGWISIIALSEHPRVQSYCDGYDMEKAYTVDSSDGLMVRSSDNTSSEAVGVVEYRQTVCPTDETTGWVKTKLTNGDSGWLSKAHLQKSDCQYVVVDKAGVYKTAFDAGSELHQLERNAKVCTLFQVTPSASSVFNKPWYKMVFNNSYDSDNVYAWIDSTVLSKYQQPIVTSDCTGKTWDDVFYSVVNAKNLNVRKSEQFEDTREFNDKYIIGALKNHDYVCPTSSSNEKIFKVNGNSATWLQTKLLNGEQGWVNKNYLHRVDCYYVGSIGLNVRNEKSFHRKTILKELKIKDKVCVLDESTSTKENSNKWFYIVEVSNQKIKGWVNSEFLLKEPVDLTKNLPADVGLRNRELKRRIAGYNSSH